MYQFSTSHLGSDVNFTFVVSIHSFTLTLPQSLFQNVAASRCQDMEMSLCQRMCQVLLIVMYCNDSNIVGKFFEGIGPAYSVTIEAGNLDTPNSGPVMTDVPQLSDLTNAKTDASVAVTG